MHVPTWSLKEVMDFVIYVFHDLRFPQFPTCSVSTLWKKVILYMLQFFQPLKTTPVVAGNTLQWQLFSQYYDYLIFFKISCLI